jgi:hypothetical protein
MGDLCQQHIETHAVSKVIHHFFQREVISLNLKEIALSSVEIHLAITIIS